MNQTRTLKSMGQLALALCLAWVAATGAAEVNWDGEIDGAWGTDANWGGNVKPVSGDDVTFDDNVTLNTAVVNAPSLNLGTVKWNSTQNYSLTIGGLSSFQVTGLQNFGVGSVLVDTSQSATLRLLDGVTPFNVATGAGDVTIANAVYKAVGATDTTLEKTGGGTLVLVGSNNFDKALLTAGTVLVGNTINATGGSPLGGGTITLNGGRLGPYGGPRTVSRAMALTAASSLGGPESLTVGGIVSGAFALDIDSDAVVTLTNAANSFTGGMTVKSGFLNILNTTHAEQAGGNNSVIGTAALTLDGGGLRGSGTGAARYGNRPLTVNSDSFIGQGVEIFAAIGGPGGLTKAESGSASIRGDNSGYAGAIMAPHGR